MSASQATNLKGLFIHPNPHTRLRQLYLTLCRILQKFPVDCNYRKNTFMIINHRREILQHYSNPDQFSNVIGCGIPEQLIFQVEREISLAKVLLSYRVWEPLVTAPPENQWKWPIIKN